MSKCLTLIASGTGKSVTFVFFFGLFKTFAVYVVYFLIRNKAWELLMHSHFNGSFEALDCSRNEVTLSRTVLYFLKEIRINGQTTYVYFCGILVVKVSEIRIRFCLIKKN